MEEWEKAAPNPARYAYHPSLKPHPFMGLFKFDTGRLHQMRSGKSYLRAHPAWDDSGPTTYRSCAEAPETFEHAILPCPAKRPARDRHLQGVTEIGPEARVWPSRPQLGALTRFIRSTATAFPPGMFSRPSSSPNSVSSRSSNVVSFGYFFVISGKLGLRLLFFRLSAGKGRVFLSILALISCPYVGLGPVRTHVEESCSGLFVC